MKVMIVGGGILGLVAARNLAKARIPTVVLERDDNVGGLCRSFEVEGQFYDRYHHFVTSSDTNLVSLIDELKIKERLIWGSTSTANFTEYGIEPINNSMDFLRLPKIPLFQKLRFGLAMKALIRARDWRPLEKIQVVDWIKNKGGQALYDRMWRYLFEMKFGDHVHEVPLSWFWARVRRRMSKRTRGSDAFALVKGSMKIVIDKLVEEIENHQGQVLTGQNVISIEPVDNGLSIKTEKGEIFKADKVIFTAPLPNLVQVAPKLSKDYKKRCQAIKYSGILNCVFILRRTLSDYFWINMNIPNHPFVGIIETTKILSTPQRHMIYLPQYLSSDHPDFDADNETILERFSKGLLKVFPSLDPKDILSRHLFKERLADPYYSLDYSKMLTEHKTPMPGLYCFNTAQIYPITRSADSSILFGKKAAELVLE